MIRLFILVFFLSMSVYAKEYTFKYKYGGVVLMLTKEGETESEAFAVAAKECFAFYMNGREFNEERGLDVIDHCANPWSKMLGQN